MSIMIDAKLAANTAFYAAVMLAATELISGIGLLRHLDRSHGKCQPDQVFLDVSYEYRLGELMCVHRAV
jgi:hypothetical protein